MPNRNEENSEADVEPSTNQVTSPVTQPANEEVEPFVVNERSENTADLNQSDDEKMISRLCQSFCNLRISDGDLLNCLDWQNTNMSEFMGQPTENVLSEVTHEETILPYFCTPFTNSESSINLIHSFLNNYNISFNISLVMQINSNTIAANYNHSLIFRPRILNSTSSVNQPSTSRNMNLYQDDFINFLSYIRLIQNFQNWLQNFCNTFFNNVASGVSLNWSCSFQPVNQVPLVNDQPLISNEHLENFNSFAGFFFLVQQVLVNSNGINLTLPIYQAYDNSSSRPISNLATSLQIPYEEISNLVEINQIHQSDNNVSLSTNESDTTSTQIDQLISRRSMPDNMPPLTSSGRHDLKLSTGRLSAVKRKRIIPTDKENIPKMNKKDFNIYQKNLNKRRHLSDVNDTKTSNEGNYRSTPKRQKLSEKLIEKESSSDEENR